MATDHLKALSDTAATQSRPGQHRCRRGTDVQIVCRLCRSWVRPMSNRFLERTSPILPPPAALAAHSKQCSASAAPCLDFGSQKHRAAFHPPQLCPVRRCCSDAGSASSLCRTIQARSRHCCRPGRDAGVVEGCRAVQLGLPGTNPRRWDSKRNRHRGLPAALRGHQQHCLPGCSCQHQPG